jgi:hypothetical protein
MPLFFGAIGIVLIICAVNNTLANGKDGLVDLVKGDFTGPNNFLVWLIAILIAGAFGYIPKFKPVSYAFLGLIFIVLLLANQKRSGSGGVFANLFDAFLNPSHATPASSQQTAVSGGDKGGGGVNIDTALHAAEYAEMFFI